LGALAEAQSTLPSRTGCFWRYHPTKRWRELGLQDEIRDGFTIDEAGS
jgi:hypothetical protein